jgi:hypothetical protein
MPSLTESLSAQHQHLIELANHLGMRLLATDLVAIGAAMRELRAALLAHLEVEDRELYPALQAAAAAAGRDDQALVARTFAENMLRISGRLRTFVEREPTAPTLEELRAGWPLVREVLMKRIDAEELVLYPMHAKLTGT